MALNKLRHMVIVLPGIMGSVLKRRGGRNEQAKDVWALSGQALLQFLKSSGSSLAELAIAQDDPTKPDLGDGIYADRLIEDIYNIPGFIDGAGYGVLLNRILRDLGHQLVQGDIHNPQPDANFFPFPYDWRRDNRASAEALKQFVETQLPVWRKKSGAKDAKVIFLAHSMGGLVARYYIENLGGWEYTRRLITFGTPHRGSLNALDMLSNGFRITGGGVKRALVSAVEWNYPHLLYNLTNLVRSFPSVYQLLPIGKVLCTDESGINYECIYDTPGIHELDQTRALSAWKDFHEKIILANAANERDKFDTGYVNRTQPVIGIYQSTFQSAYVENRHVTPSYHPPRGLGLELADGDGTVPRISAIPRELENSTTDPVLLSEHHGWLTNVTSYLETLKANLEFLSAQHTGGLLGPSDLAPMRGLDLRVDPLYLAGEPVDIEIELKDTKATPPDMYLHIERVDAPLSLEPLPVNFGNEIIATITIPSKQVASKLPIGLYRARLVGEDAHAVTAQTNTLFEVVE